MSRSSGYEELRGKYQYEVKREGLHARKQERDSRIIIRDNFCAEADELAMVQPDGNTLSREFTMEPSRQYSSRDSLDMATQ